MTRETLEVIGKRFNEIRPDYNITFGEENYVNEVFTLTDFLVDAVGRVTMEIQEAYLKSNYAIGYRTHIRHPRLNKAEVRYLLGD